MDKQTEYEAAAFRRLVKHLQERSDVQNIDLMNDAGFCRNCLARWMSEASDGAITRNEAKTIVYGMPYEEWKAKFQNEATEGQKVAFDDAIKAHQ